MCWKGADFHRVCCGAKTPAKIRVSMLILSQKGNQGAQGALRTAAQMRRGRAARGQPNGCNIAAVTQGSGLARRCASGWPGRCIRTGPSYSLAPKKAPPSNGRRFSFGSKPTMPRKPPRAATISAVRAAHVGGNTRAEQQLHHGGAPAVRREVQCRVATTHGVRAKLSSFLPEKHATHHTHTWLSNKQVTLIITFERIWLKFSQNSQN
eukprot:COSAG06_NODE_762_length_12488_cov_36.564614_9_plen_208_part_00